MRLVSWTLVLIFAAAPLEAGGSGGRATYVGGTVSGLQGKTNGVIRTTDEHSLFFLTRKVSLEVPYEAINLLEYGQQVSRRFAMAIAISPLLLLSKKRGHFLTIGYSDEEGRQQAAVFQIDKSAVRSVLASLEARTGLKLQYQNDEARKGGKG